MKINKSLPHYIGSVHPNCDYHHGQIQISKGAHCFGVTRANRQDKSKDDGIGYTYKHAADLAYFNNKFYIQYLCNPKDEHVGAGISVLASSDNGIDWNNFTVSFPEYKIKKCTVTDYLGNTHTFDGTTFAFMHQRMSFFKSSNGKLLVLGFYGWSPAPYICNWDNYGIGRCVRTINEDGSLGPIYFIRCITHAGWSEDLLLYPMYNKSDDEQFVQACDELLANKLYTQQWAEEHGDLDDLITIKHNKSSNQAFTWYQTTEQEIIAMWKHSKVAKSIDNGKTWSPIEKSYSLVMSGQKVFTQKLSDNKYACVYVPTLESQHRYPMCVTTSNDGYAFSNMLNVHGEVPPMRYEGFWKDFGPSYMHGITQGIDLPTDGYMWLSYSVNKEDIWILRLPYNYDEEEIDSVNEDFSNDYLPKNFSIYSPKWASVTIVRINNKNKLRLSNKDPYDYSKVERLLKKSVKKRIELSVTPNQNNFGHLCIEVLDNKNTACMRLMFKDDGNIYLRTTANIPLCEYSKGTDYLITIELDCDTFTYTLKINDKSFNNAPYIFMNAVNIISSISVKTGERRYLPNLDSRPEDVPYELKNGHIELEEASYDLNYLVSN